MIQDSDYDSVFYTFLRKVRNAVFSLYFHLGLSSMSPTVLEYSDLETEYEISRSYDYE